MKVQNDPNITNNTAPRNNELIALGPTRNIQVTQKVFRLNSRIFLKRRKIIPMIAPNRIIKIVEYWVGGSIR